MRKVTNNFFQYVLVYQVCETTKFFPKILSFLAIMSIVIHVFIIIIIIVIHFYECAVEIHGYSIWIRMIKHCCIC